MSTAPFKVPPFEELVDALAALLRAGIGARVVFWEPEYGKAYVQVDSEPTFRAAMKVLGAKRAQRSPYGEGWELRSVDAPITITAHTRRRGALDR